MASRKPAVELAYPLEGIEPGCEARWRVVDERSGSILQKHCRTCAEVALAKRGVDPARTKQEELESLRRPAITLGENQPGPAGQVVGSQLNLFA